MVDRRTDDGTEKNGDTSRRTFLKATGAATASAGVGTGAVSAASEDRAEETDVEAMLADLTLEQKVGQMTQVDVGTFDPESAEIPDSFGVETLGEYFSELELGSIISGGASPPTFDPEETVTGINALQEYNLDNADHSIPFLWGVDALHGNTLLAGSTSFPQRINMGATRNIEAIEDAARQTADSAAAMGAHWTFAPTTDLQRDPRWGRFYEGITEDPAYLGEVSKARVRGLESNDRLCSTVKHFGAYSIPENGNDRAHARTSMRDLRTSLLPPYRTALEADPATVMVNSGAVNGKPAHASEWLLTQMLRERYGFDGVVVSDYDDFYRMLSNHDYTDSFRRTVKEGLNAGVDMYMIGNGGEAPGPAEFIETTVSLVEDGEVSTECIDESVRRILELKDELGLFEEPTVDESEIDAVLGGGQAESEQLARESMVLLKNDDALPLSGGEDVLLAGPGYDPDLDLENRFLMRHGGWTLGWQGIEEGAPSEGGPRPRGETITEALEGSLDGTLTHVPTDFRAQPYNPETSDANGDFGFTDEQEADVREAAGSADAVVVVLGEGPHNEGFGDRNELALDPAQRELVAAVEDEAPDTPVVGVVLAGSPRGGTETFDSLDAVVFAGQPGSDGGHAIAETLLGGNNPSGKLAFNWPESVGKVPNNYDAYPPLDDQEPLYAFGHGLSYTDFEYSGLSVSPGSVSDPANTPTVTASVGVENTGDEAGEHVVEVYNTQSYGSVLQPDRRLLGYERVALDAGESTTVDLDLDLSALEVVPGDVPGILPKVVEPGEYELTAGKETTTLSVENAGSITDDRPAVGFDLDDGNAPAGLVEFLRGLGR
ncbi:beta-glucosidase [Halalkalicoccus jeotgali]|uniref:beta-glucosidase n=1 Tax=Halalkalicoccus jeotgali (strain DSM 18796 / CECT 7217 / JCM 14584 / KCTC 4019 / B3) TaxID=795797 RepID=D8J5Z9_HALJB|nr:glycoside hydrolase family 3 N-terminal domain-containing protein [Halalkalicoccus jeotgali]ADJ13805.1 beta-glucosidase [Halalkalicoccus jeotgali B3]ELY34149.1 beta-glucosidase [Halalkalicoccus jeotgali B3]